MSRQKLYINMTDGVRKKRKKKKISNKKKKQNKQSKQFFHRKSSQYDNIKRPNGGPFMSCI